ncbi:MAG TPA: (deoxy)nucleoside triphosphate pyrophosphohydrolase [Marmoricola sp.]
MKSVEVVGAVIVREGKILCARRGPGTKLGGMWEFPGGKVEAGESPRAALVREIREELECVIRVGAEITTTTHEYAFGTIVLTTFWCDLEQGEPIPGEHSELRWLLPADLDQLEWAPADVPAVEIIRTRRH